jgi:hypothetical protein
VALAGVGVGTIVVGVVAGVVEIGILMVVGILAGAGVVVGVLVIVGVGLANENFHKNYRQ